MARCRQCDLIISGAAERCPRCGYPLPSRSRIITRGMVIVVLLVILFAGLRSGGLLDKETVAPSPKVDEAGPPSTQTAVPPVPYLDLSKAQNDRPRGSDKPSFDCAKAKTAAARLICADAELARLDGELGVAFRRRKAQISAPDQSKLVAEQLAWLGNRNTRCDLIGKDNAAIEVLANSKACMVVDIKERIAVLSQTDFTAANKCEKYEPAVVTLKGVVNIVQAYGPPNFGEDPAHDAKEPFNKLTVERPICVDQGKDDLEPGVSEAAEFQLVLGIGQSSPQSFPSRFLGKPVTISGKLFHSITGHHHTEVLIDVTSIALDEVAAGDLLPGIPSI